MDRASDVVNGHGLRNDLVGFRVIQLDRSWVSQLCEPRAIFVQVFQILGRRNGHRDHLAPFFRRPDRINLHAGAGLLQQAHVLVNVFGVGQHAGRTGDVAQHSFGSRHVLRGGKVIDERRCEIRRRRVLLNLRGVGLVHRLFRIARWRRLIACRCAAGRGKQKQQRETYAATRCTLFLNPSFVSPGLP